jgi:hypothetical protein
MKKHYIYSVLIGLLIILLKFTGCKDEDFTELTNLEFNRVLAPTKIRTEIINKNNIKVTWNAVEGADRYIIQVSRDSLAFQNIIDTIDNIDTVSIIIGNLDYLTRYSVRVMAKSADGTKSDSKFNFTTLVTEGILYPLAKSDIKSTMVTLKWVPGVQVTHLTIKKEGQDAVQYDISAQEITDGKKVCTGLETLTSYSVKIYNGEVLLGSLTFKTPDSKVYTSKDGWLDAIINAESGAYISLAASDTFVFTATLPITKPITIVGEAGEQKPLIIFNTGSATTCITIDLTEAGDVWLENLNINGSVGFTTAKNNYLITPGGDKLKNLDIVDCYISHIQRGFIRTNSTVSTSSLRVTIDNCIFTDVTASNNDFIDFRNFSAQSVTLKNSTLDSCALTRTIVRVSNFPSTINIDHCTIYKACGGAATSPLVQCVNDSKVTISNNIFDNVTVVPFFLAGFTTGTINIKYNNYTNSDGISSYLDQTFKTEVAPDFIDAFSGDFTLPSGSALRSADQYGKALGDPRWAK